MKPEDGSLAARIAAELEESIQVKEKTLEEQLTTLEEIGQAMLGALREGNKVILFGNGGSAADSQHIAAEFINRFRLERRAMPAIALTTDSSVLTSIANDYSFDNVFSRQIEAIGESGDVALGISTSGNSPNVLKAFETARQLGIDHSRIYRGERRQNGRSCRTFAFTCPLRVPPASRRFTLRPLTHFAGL